MSTQTETDVRTYESDPSEHPLCEHCGDYHPRWEYRERTADGRTSLTCPSCGHEFRYADHLDVFEELFVTIASNRRGDHAEKMARALLRHERGTRELVGLTSDVERALYCNTAARRIVSVAFDKHGVYEAVEAVATVRDAAAWIDTCGESLAWTHPRYDSDTSGIGKIVQPASTANTGGR
ncbi:MAG: hypothetical protein ABEJ28_05980 [Salinigranum sp.]